ncbi:hypothetical protein THRCLA_20563 [Thraustotheca clavata]|uniref:Uncharacterized protein n=1 Tax=Thraustotheca clavata TaxID=74557 RepID=A0A1W0A5S6_9STRA|nr:hypothetical protein THRCLA_20563 [Thraustotheca clavata]
MASPDDEKRGRFYMNAPHKNSDNIRGVLSSYSFSMPLTESKDVDDEINEIAHGHGIQRWHSALEMLEDIYFALTNMNEKVSVHHSKCLTRLGKCIIEVKKAADEVISTLSVIPSTSKQVVHEEIIDKVPDQQFKCSFSNEKYHQEQLQEDDINILPPVAPLPDVKVYKKKLSPKKNPHKQKQFQSLRDEDMRLLAQLHAEFHEKKESFKILRQRVQAAEVLAKNHVDEKKATLQQLQRLRNQIDF